MKEYLNLLGQREAKVVLGRRYFNLWLLTLVLAAMLISVAFSNGSLKYLSEKMNDPFTNWVDISNGYGSSDLPGFLYELQQPETQQHYLFKNVQADHYSSFTFYGKNKTMHYLRCRFFEHLNSELVEAILDPQNVVSNSAISREKLVDKSFGFIVTKDVMKKLGYAEDSIPAYIQFLSNSMGADTLGFDMIEGKFALAPVPVLGVVNRLPGNMDMIASSFFLEQNSNDLYYPFSMNNVEYAKSLTYYVTGDINTFQKKVSSVMPSNFNSDIIVEDEQLPYASWKPGTIVSIYPDRNEVGTKVYKDLSLRIASVVSPEEATRIFKYQTSDYHFNESEYISVNFLSLDSIRAFETFAKEKFKVDIEMSQVNAKENFNDVSLMANILSWAMIIFSIVCIVMFIVNMLQSYFQKVKKNIGTFKAFGISSFELIAVYVLILICIIFSALAIALVVAWGIELLLPVFGVMKDGEFSYLALWSAKTFWAIGVVVLSTIVTVYVVMRKLLDKTPGDLIYDR